MCVSTEEVCCRDSWLPDKDTEIRQRGAPMVMGQVPYVDNLQVPLGGQEHLIGSNRPLALCLPSNYYFSRIYQYKLGACAYLHN